VLDPKQPTEARVAAAWALDMQGARLDGALDDAEVVRALSEAAQAPEPELRQMAVNALAFCSGDAAAQALRASLKDEDRITRYDAATGLARRGDPAALSTLKEMLSTRDLDQALTVENAAEKRNQIEAIEKVALKSLQHAIRAGHTGLAQALRPELTALTKSGLVSVRLEAEALLKELPPAS
jgi:HEAT repeat protein